MADPRASFNKINKIRKEDLSEEFQLDLSQNLLTEEDHKKLDSISYDGGANKLIHAVNIDLGGVKYIFDGSKDVTVQVSVEALGASSIDHNHDNRYSKTTHEHNYAGSESPGGAANSAKKLTEPIKVQVTGAVTGEVTADLSGDVVIDTQVNHEHNYAGSESPGGAANKADRLTNPINIELEGSVVGSAEFDGSKSIKIKALTNHGHPQYSLIDHCHDNRYAKINHVHYYAGSDQPSGAAFKADKFTNPVKINITGSETGSFDINGDEGVIDVELEATHTHNFNDIVNVPDAIKNPNPLTLTYAGENPVEYDGDTTVRYDIPAAHSHYSSVENFPKQGSEHTLYTDSNDMSYRWDKDTNTYKNVGVPVTMLSIIDGNLV